MLVRVCDHERVGADGAAWVLVPGESVPPDQIAAAPAVVIVVEDALVDARSARRLVELASQGVVAVPRSPSVVGRGHVLLTTGDDVGTVEGREALAERVSKHFAGLTEDLELVPTLAVAVPGAWAARALDERWTTVHELFARLVDSRPAELAFDAVAVARRPVEGLVPAAPRRRPLVSACMIVRDEAVWLADAIDSLAGFADEVVVYDTGSTDATVDVARRHGARVIEGTWDDDFGAARNRSAADARGEWIVWLDADERLGGDLATARARLADPLAQWEGYSVRIRNLTGVGLTWADHFAMRLFRRAAGAWRGALHETVWSRDHARPLNAHPASELHLVHLGYLDVVMRQRGKGERNLRVASHNESASEPLEALVHEIRSRLLAGEHATVVALVEDRVLPAPPGPLRKLGLLAGFESALALGSFDVARTFVDALATQPDVPAAFALEASARLAATTGDLEGALRDLAGIDTRVEDVDGLVVDPERLAGLTARCLAGLGRFDEASDVVVAALARGTVDVDLREVVAWFDHANRPLADLESAIHPEQRQLIAASVLPAAELAERLFWAFVEANPACTVWLAAGELAARRVGGPVHERWRRLLADAGLVPSA
ncbi:glycosyl transferase family 2 [Acidimicrobium ferrooxidans DSM 10331]|uniref:Glycosyl transferase family 2 n=1 Tax=Acidimicrobium ferrooxidans (strain DSM 10331 / JCM 15462 / NBRC 103882 / ICP) TaxID=525909 RepID=C7M291_ACIFD|nr:glycosyltransferase family 2 protein [Acidimicrobium ferrooxidans]ACU53189.1 glycosyl transferase family 2 [Acidimicrobium ferrooxidans DSM 10331]